MIYTRKEQGNQVRRLRLAVGLNQDELALKTGYAEKSMISRIENGATQISSDKFELFADAFHMSVVEFINAVFGIDLSGKSNEAELKDIAVNVYGKTASLSDLFSPENALFHVSIPNDWRGKYFALYVSDDSLSSEFPNHSVIIFREQDSAPDGSYVLVQLNKRKTAIMQFLKTKTGLSFLPVVSTDTASKLREPLPYDSDYSILGVVVEVRRKYLEII